MKRNYMLILLTLFALVIFGSVKKVNAQTGDTLTVEWQDGSGNFIIDALRFAIEGDTLNKPAGRVYKLRKGGYYWVTETIINNGWHLRIVGEDPVKNDPAGSPAVIQRVARTDGTVTGRLITGGGDITFKNLYFISCDDAGTQGAYQPIQIDASDSRTIIDHCIFERTSYAPVAWTGKNNDIFLTNNVYRNLIESPGTQQWGGRGVSIWGDEDTVIVENNTFFNVGFTAFQLETGAANYLRFNHNTLVNVGRGFNTVPWYKEAYMGNNLIVNGFWHGEGYSDITASGRDPRATTSGMFGIGSLPSKYGPEAGRRILLANTAAWLDPKFTAYYADSIRAQPFVGPVTKEDYLDKYDQMVAVDTMWLSQRPDFPTYPSDIIDQMIGFISSIRVNTGTVPLYFWQLPIDPGTGLVSNVTPSWPLPENFSYTTPALLTAGTDGLPLGDLNWFPTQKASFYQNLDANVAHLQSLAGGIIVFTPVGDQEAEIGAVSGTASVQNYTGELPYFDMKGGGSITWTFNMPTAATVELNVSTRSQDARRGQHIKVNGTELLNYTGSGEYSWFDLDPTNWKVYNINKDTLAATSTGAALDLPAGVNTIVISPSWGYQAFLYVEVKSGGNVIQTLNATNAVVDVVTIVSNDPTIYVPSAFKYVDMGTNGSVAWTFNVANAGNYALSITYQGPNGPQTGQLVAGGNSVPVDFPGVAGENGALSVLTDAVALGAGNQTFTLSAGNILVDKVQLNEKTVSSVKQLPGLPEGFALLQNYPNPFNPTTTINFNLGKPANVKLTVYNILGQKVATLINNTQMNAGNFSVDFNASHLSSGVYFYSIEAGDFKVQKKMMLLK